MRSNIKQSAIWVDDISDKTTAFSHSMLHQYDQYQFNFTIANQVRKELKGLKMSLRRPDFVIAGVKKAGTTVLIDTVKKHSKAVE